MSQILVTGASGYVGTQLIAALLRRGSDGGSQPPVRAVVRTAAREDGLRAAVRRAPGLENSAGGAGLEVVTADLTSDDGWKAAMAGVDEVYHVASPIPAAQPKDPDELIVPAREGTLRVLRAARDAGARRVVLTSSFAAIGYSPNPGGAEFTEDDWTDPDTPGLPPYPRSKAIAERAAWDLMNHDGGGTELVVVNPTFILGPTLTTGLSTLAMVKGMLDGTLSVVRRQRFGVADVRDVADLHIRAMAAPAAAGKRFLALADGPTISFLQLAEILHQRLGPLGARVNVQEAPGEEPPPLVIHNDRARNELGWRPRPVETTIIDSAESLRDLGLLAEQS
jgi:nucleoside-diphosphate-sugar epimerase